MKSTTIALTLLAAGVQAYPEMTGKAMGKRSSQGSAGPMGNSGYSAPVAEDIKTKCLQAHNDGRAAYGMPLLRWNDELAQSAQGWANNIGRNMQHSGHNGYGENLAFNSRGDVREMILKQWFDECPEYGGGFSEGAGHYSQCVWKDTTDVGCGFNDDDMLVCQYYPAGNMEGDYGSNVPPPGQCVPAANLPVGSGGQGPAGTPGYGGSSQAPTTPSGPGYGGQAPTGGQAPSAPSGPSYGGQAPSGGQAPNHGGRPHPRPHKPAPKPDCDEEDQKPQHGGRPKPRPRPVPQPAPKPVYKAPAPQQAPTHGQRPSGGHRGQRPQQNDEDCDDEDQAPTHGGRGPRPYGGNMGSGPSRGGMGSGPSRGGDYDNNGPSWGGRGGQAPSGGRGGYSGGRGGSSGGHGGDDGDCED